MYAEAVVRAATNEKRIKLTGSPQRFPFLSDSLLGLKREKSQKFKYRAAKYVTHVAATAIIAAKLPGVTEKPVCPLARSAKACGSMVTLNEMVPALMDRPIAKSNIIAHTAGPAKSMKRRTVSIPLLIIKSWAAHTPR